MHKRNTTLPDVEKFSPATQKMVLMAFYERWNMLSTKEISNRLQFSRMSAGRCLIELQSLVLIGGAACDIIFEDVGQEFRATRALDLVLIIEALTPEFGVSF